MIEHHPWPRIKHHAAYLLAPVRLIAMNGAFGAGGFIGLDWTPVDSLQGIGHQSLALSTRANLRVMMPLAVNLDHNLDGMPLPINAILIRFHCDFQESS